MQRVPGNVDIWSDPHRLSINLVEFTYKTNVDLLDLGNHLNVTKAPGVILDLVVKTDVTICSCGLKTGS